MNKFSHRLNTSSWGRLFVAMLLADVAGTVQAQTAAPGAATASPFTANVALVSQYVSRGFRQTWGRPALQGGFDYAHPSGFSAGTWLSTVSNRFAEDATLEWDLYGAYTGTADGFAYSGAIYYYLYPGAEYRATNTTYDYGELVLGLTYKFAYIKYSHTYTKEFFGIENARGTGYLDIGANVDLGGGCTLNLHMGQGRVANNSMWNWRDYKVGLSKALTGGWTVAGAYTKAKGATDAYDNYTLGIPNSAGVIESSNPGTGTFVLSLAKAF